MPISPLDLKFMKIVDFKIHSIAIADPPLRSSYGLHTPYALRNVVELTSEDGIVGISETYGGEAPRKALGDLRSRIIGADAFKLTGQLQPMVRGSAEGFERSQTYLVPGENPLDAQTRTFAAIEIACLDLIGKSIGQPVCDIIGGRECATVFLFLPTRFSNTRAAAAKVMTAARTSTAKYSHPRHLFAK